MPKKPRTAVSKRQYDGVIVGVRMETATVDHVWLRSDGGMSAGGRIHFPPEGKTAMGEAMLVFGLTSFRVFPPDDVAARTAYAAKLEAEIDAEHETPPEIL